MKIADWWLVGLKDFFCEGYICTFLVPYIKLYTETDIEIFRMGRTDWSSIQMLTTSLNCGKMRCYRALNGRQKARVAAADLSPTGTLYRIGYWSKRIVNQFLKRKGYESINGYKRRTHIFLAIPSSFVKIGGRAFLVFM